MKCPHCGVQIHPAFTGKPLRSVGVATTGSHPSSNEAAPVGTERGRRTFWTVYEMECPACKFAIINLTKELERSGLKPTVINAYPKNVHTRSAPPEVPPELAEDFNEASAVIADSPKASAALSRRCLQHLLRLQGFAQHDLAKAIDAALAKKIMPGPLARNLDAIRNIGNFAAHPTKNTNSGAIVEVEPEEAEWNLDVLIGLFDFFYVQPAHDTARIEALNAKLKASGKPPMKA